MRGFYSCCVLVFDDVGSRAELRLNGCHLKSVEYASQITNRAQRFTGEGLTAFELHFGKTVQESTIVFRREGDSNGAWQKEVEK